MRLRKFKLVLAMITGILVLGGAVAIASAHTGKGPASQPPAAQQAQPASPQAEKADRETAAQAVSASEKEDVAGGDESNLPNGGHADPQGSSVDHQHEGAE